MNLGQSGSGETSETGFQASAKDNPELHRDLHAGGPAPYQQPVSLSDLENDEK